MMKKPLLLLFVASCSLFAQPAPTIPLWYFSPGPEGEVGSLTSIYPLKMVTGSKFIVKIDDRGGSDFLQIEGASLTIEPGSCVEVIAPAGYPTTPTTYTIITTGEPISGEFDQTSCSGPGHFRAEVCPQEKQIDLILYPLDYAPKASSPDTLAIAGYLDAIGMISPDLHLVFDKLDLLDCCRLNQALRELQPSQFGAFALAQENTYVAVRSTFSHRLQEIYTDRCSPLSRWNLWAEPFAKFAHREEQQGFLGYHQESYGALIGFDCHPTSQLIAGLGIAASHTDLSWERSAGSGSIRTGYLGGYASYFTKRYAIDASFLAGYDHYQATRNLSFLNRKASHKNNGYAYAGQLGVKLFVPYKTFQIEPQALAEYITLYQNDFREHEADSLNIKVEAKYFRILRTELGAVLSRCYNFKKSTLIPELALSWVHTRRFNSPTYEAHYLRAPGCFKVPIFNKHQNYAMPTAALTSFFKTHPFTLSLRYTGQYNQDLSENILSLQSNYRF